VYRQVRAARETNVLKVLYHPGNVLEIRFKKPSMKYKAGQWLFLNVPEVSGWQWHPVRRRLPHSESDKQFTISSAPEDPFISIHIRQVGDFTVDLGVRLGATPMGHKLHSAEGSEKQGFKEVEMGLGAGSAVEVEPDFGRGMPKLRIDG
jgi:NADPH oxidase